MLAKTVLNTLSRLIYPQPVTARAARMTEALAAAEPWHASFPSPVSVPARISVDELRQVLAEHGAVSNECLVVDVRRTDFDVRAAHNWGRLCRFFPSRC